MPPNTLALTFSFAFLPFEGEITFDVTQPTEATLIFQKDDPSGINVLAEHPVAVVLLPSGE
ncbi:hypothetical protein [Henriciella marina]|uniref:Uncharacterized protein n=1 Tax=Henriciella marina TaxID=453851 RepID=A0ABT4LVZ5_9PROT|nr:hypothetical protein [Henriciella marina]MCZ4298526.1 hypothetical protein [Henriciella marina]